MKRYLSEYHFLGINQPPKQWGGGGDMEGLGIEDDYLLDRQ